MTTAHQVAMMMEASEPWRQAFMSAFNREFVAPAMARLVRLVVRRRPHTDDMLQMLCDMGIEAADQ